MFRERGYSPSPNFPSMRLRSARPWNALHASATSTSPAPPHTTRIHVAVLIGGNDDRSYRVDRDPDVIAMLTAEAEGFPIVLTVHDELVFEAPPGEVTKLVDMVRREMTTALKLDRKSVV